jgi:hypothetical protein
LGIGGVLDLTRQAFDDEGFFKLGNNLRFVNDNNPSKGFVLVK